MAKSFVDKIIDKASDTIFGKESVTGSNAPDDLRKGRNRIDEVNRQLEDTSPQDTENTKRIFEK